jgi:hypothetical protein
MRSWLIGLVFRLHSIPPWARFDCTACGRGHWARRPWTAPRSLFCSGNCKESRW